MSLRITGAVGLLCVVLCARVAANPESVQFEGDPVRVEVNIAYQDSHFAEDIIFHLDPYPIEIAGSLLWDTLSFMVNGRYYFNSRFVNPAVPFAFIPYDYRSNAVGLFARYGAEEAKLEWDADSEPIFEDQEYETRVAVFGLGGQYHMPRYFIGGSFLFERETDSGRNRLLQLSATGGWLTKVLKVGLRSVVGKEFQGRLFTPTGPGQVYVTGQPFLEYTSGSFVRVSAAISRTHAVTFGDYWEMELPVSLNYTIPDQWWEFGVTFAYFSNEQDVERYTFKANIRKFIGDGSIYALGGIAHGDFLPILLGDDGTMVHFGVGGDFVYKRIIQLSLKYKHEFGDPILGHDDRHGHTLAVTLRFFD